VERARAGGHAKLAASLALPAAWIRESLLIGKNRRLLLGECLVEVRNGVGEDWNSYPVLGATRQGLAPAKENVGKNPERYKLVDPVTVFYNPMRILLGSIAMVDDEDDAGITSPDYVVVKGKEGILDTRWFYYWFRSAQGARLIDSLSRGAVRERILFNRLAPGEIEVPCWDEQRGVSQHVVLNAAKVVLMTEDERLRDIIATCNLVNADGTSVVWASRMLGSPLPERVAGIDLFLRIVERASQTGHRVYFLGATDDVLDSMLAVFRKNHPGLQIGGWHNGYWGDDEAVVAAVREAKPSFLFLAIPSPRKEYWLRDHLAELEVPFVMGVGGAFDVVAGKVKRAPQWVQRIGFEWMYRLMQEPRRMWKRYLHGNTAFILLTLREWRRRSR
jgi:N-acetylglucosaminyldiphosphoundecaprenol N-acetyl-beta-D-mannosaminyltransferase